MLSILIAIFNIDVRDLVKALDSQCQAADIDYEILCFDDHSQSAYHHLNQELAKLDCVQYRRLEQNQGRAQLRNRLGQAARFPYLLFMDGDSRIVADDYIQQYVQQLLIGKVLVGKTVYQELPPEAKEQRLRWHYGIHREQISATKRQQAPYQSFRTHHFVIPKKVFDQVPFQGTLLRYGHEDTLFGLALQQQGIAIQHLDTPLEHTGLDTAKDFINKSKAAIKNLSLLAQTEKRLDTRLLRSYQRLHSLSLTAWLGRLYPYIAKPLEWQLQTLHPSLWLFDGYRLCYLCWLKHQFPK